MRISNVSFKSFPPFADGSIRFPVLESAPGRLAEVHFFVGANGTGKTRFLSLLLSALGNPAELERRLNGQKIQASVLMECENGKEIVYRFPTTNEDAGYFTRSGSKPPPLSIPVPTEKGYYSVHFQRHSAPFPSVLKFVQEDHFAALAFRGASAEVSDADVQALAPVNLGSPSDHLEFGRSKNEDSIVGQSMVNIKMGAAMDKLDETSGGPGRSSKIDRRIEDTVSSITGRPFSFRVEPHPKISLRVNWGQSRMMTLLQLPDGLRAIIGWLVSCAAKLEALFPEVSNPLDLPVIVVIDEPEGHLHPSWQRKVLPALQEMLPNAQIFAATHSPWIVSSINHGFIHVFKLNEKERVEIQSPRRCSEGDTYIDVVEDILGVTERYDPETEKLLAEYRLERDALKGRGKGSVDEVRALAEKIGRRSDSLSLMMGRELAQLERQLAAK